MTQDPRDRPSVLAAVTANPQGHRVSSHFGRALLAATIVGVGCGAVDATPQMPASSRHPLVGKPAPSIDRRQFAGPPLAQARAGRPITVIKFFAQYCVPCRRGLAEAQKLSERRHDVLVVGISEDESAAQVQAQIARYGLRFPILHDRGQVLAGRFRVASLPWTFVVSRGTVVWAGDGSAPVGAMERAVRASANPDSVEPAARDSGAPPRR